jgi:hypothetical protein
MPLRIDAEELDVVSDLRLEVPYPSDALDN